MFVMLLIKTLIAQFVRSLTKGTPEVQPSPFGVGGAKSNGGGSIACSVALSNPLSNSHVP